MNKPNPQDIPASSIELINACNFSPLRLHVVMTILDELSYVDEQSIQSELLNHRNLEKLFATLIYDLVMGGK